MYYRVVAGGECYGVGTSAECEQIIDMHRKTPNGHGKPSRISAMDLRVERVDGKYPLDTPAPKLGYKPGRVPTTGELK